MANDRENFCFKCEYFIQFSDETTSGVCCRHAPQKMDETQADPLRADPLFFFGTCSEPTVEFCGEFKATSGEIPPPFSTE